MHDLYIHVYVLMYNYLCLCLGAVIQGGAGCTDPGTDEEGRQLIQPMGTETAC